MNTTYPSPQLRGRTRPLMASAPAVRAPAAQKTHQPDAESEAWGLLTIRDSHNAIIGSGFYSEEGKVTLIFDAEPQPGRILIYNRTPSHPGAARISANLNIKDATNDSEHLTYLGKLRQLSRHDGWWGDLDRAPRGRDQRGRPRCFACVPPQTESKPTRRTSVPQSRRRHGQPLWATKRQGAK